MTIEKVPFPVEIIALDFYDGATEGFSISVADLGPAYFKLLAWDEDQDQRLFIVVSISADIFDSILSLLYKINGNPSSKMWLPNWEFRNVTDEAEANNILETCQKDVILNSILLKGSIVTDKLPTVYKINDTLLPSIARAMREPESLDSWLAMLESTLD